MRLPRLRDILLVLAAFPAALLITLPFTWRHLHAQIVLGNPLRQELGFSESSPYTPDPRNFLGQREVVAAGSVDPDSLAARAGLRANDVFVEYCRRDRGATALFLDLEKSRGREFCTAVAALFDAGPLERRPRRRVCLAGPKSRP